MTPADRLLDAEAERELRREMLSESERREALHPLWICAHCGEHGHDAADCPNDDLGGYGSFGSVR